MGDRVSVQFVNGEDKSVVLFHHWGGEDFAKKVVPSFLNSLPLAKGGDPITRREPQTIMRVFVGWLSFNGIVKQDNYSAYFGFDENDGDNSDNGHFVCDLKNNKVKHVEVD